MNPKSIERALDRYRAFKDEDVRRRLAIFGPLILEAAAISNELDDEDVVVEREPTADETIAASKPNGTPLLRAGFVRINADSFCRCAKHLGSVLLKSLELDEKLGSAAQHFDFAPYCTEALVRTASENPHGYLEAVVKLWDSGDADEALLDIFVLPVLGETLRAYLTRFAEKASGLLERPLIAAPILAFAADRSPISLRSLKRRFAATSRNSSAAPAAPRGFMNAFAVFAAATTLFQS